MRTLLLLACAGVALAQDTFSGAAAIDDEVNQAIRHALIPGAVVEVGHQGAVVFRKAYGSRALIPKREAMTVDTVFDAASLTKVIATTSCLMKLFDEGKFNVDAAVTSYLPEFQGGHSNITVRNLMTHYSGLRPDLDLVPAWGGYDTGIERALTDVPVGPPATRFVYSDINYILLGEIVHRLSGKTLDRFSRDVVFDPIGMKRTRFGPPADWVSKIAPTELDKASGLPIRGVVHDNTSRFMGGVAGHAGMFTTADDLALFAQMMLDGGLLNGKRIFSVAAIQTFTAPQSPPGLSAVRGFGWDIDSAYSKNRGDLFPIGSFGHTGFTGTSIWIDPSSKTYVILLANSVHPHRGKNLGILRGRVATIAAEAVGVRPAPEQRVLTGLDILNADQFAPLAGKRVGLITNHTGLSRDGKRNIDLMVASGTRLVQIFTPEHGLAGIEDQPDVADSKDQITGIPAISLYRDNKRRLTPEMLKDIDALVFDIQDVGARYYTYSCTLLSSLEESARKHIPFFVLDRPNPITGTRVEGPLLEPGLESFVGCYEMPLRHGMTFGELASMVNGERHLGADLRVIRMKNWARREWFDATGLTWVDTSPNLRSLNAATLYPGIAMLEAARNYSVGRGTDAPFEQIGADWIDGVRLAGFLNSRGIPGVRVYPTRFRPTSSNFQGKTIGGIRFVVTDREQLESTRLGLEVGYALEKLFPGKMPWEVNRFLIGNRAVVEAGKRALDPKATLEEMRQPLAQFLERRQKYLLYE